MRPIDADELFHVFEETDWWDNADRDDVAEDLLLKQPTVDAIPVIRCKNCRFSHAVLVSSSHLYYCRYNHKTVDEMDYCSKGENKREKRRYNLKVVLSCITLLEILSHMTLWMFVVRSILIGSSLMFEMFYLTKQKREINCLTI